jgi:hypothetical protein
MLAKPAEDLIYPNGPNTIPVIPNAENYMNSLFPWGTTIDGTDAGVLDFPKVLLRKGAFPKVPVIFGSNTNEFQTGCWGPRAFNLTTCGFINKIDFLMQRKMDLDNETDLHQVLSFVTYPGVNRWHDLSDEDFGKLVALYPAANFHSGAERLSRMMVDSNRWIGHCSTLHAAQLIRAHSENVWVYHFDFPGNKFVSGGMTGHGSELPFVFGRCNALPFGVACQGANSTAVAAASAIFAASWSSLARTGKPIEAWPKLDSKNTILKIGQHGGTPETNYRDAFCNLWETLDPFFPSVAGSSSHSSESVLV